MELGRGQKGGRLRGVKINNSISGIIINCMDGGKILGETSPGNQW